MAEGDADRIAAAHQDALDERLTAVVELVPSARRSLPRARARAASPRPGTCSLGLGADLPLEALLEALDLAGRVDDGLLARVERVAVGADVDAELGRVEPTSTRVPHDPQSTLAS